MSDLQEADSCPDCAVGRLRFSNPYSEGCCSCHINPPCGYCTGMMLCCNQCDFIDEPPPLETKSYNLPAWKPEPYKPKPCGNGMITGYRYDGSSGSTMVFEGTYTGDVTNSDLLEFFGTGTFGHRFGFCGGGRFKFTKITD